MMTLHNHIESELICKTIDRTGIFHKLFAMPETYRAYLIISDDTSDDVDSISQLVYEDESSSFFYINMKSYLTYENSPISVSDNKLYILAVKSGGGIFEHNYFEYQDDSDIKNFFEYFYPDQHGKGSLTIDEEIAKHERQMEKYYEQRLKSKVGGITNELPTGGTYYKSQVVVNSTFELPPRKDIVVDLDFINEL